MMVLDAKNISVTVWGVKLVDNASLCLAEGEVVAIIGPNGAGKSTLLNALAGGVYEHQRIKGSIVYAGKDLAEWTPEEKAKSMGILPQLSTLNFPFTVEEVIKLSRIPHSTGDKIDSQIIQSVLKTLDIDDLQQRLYTQLSGGERLRAQLARVMAQIWRSEDARQRVLLLDEPTSSLDLGHQQQLMKVLRQLANDGVGVIIVAHDINLVAQYADRLLALHCGETVAQGLPNEVITPQLMKELYQVDVSVMNNQKLEKPIVVFNH